MLPGVSNEALGAILAGVIGVLVIFGVAVALAYSRRLASDNRRQTMDD